MREEETIKEIADRVLSGINKKLNNKSKIINDLWYEIIGENTKKHTKVEGIKDKVLYIRAESPAWIYETKNKKKEIIEKINKQNKEEILKDIKIKLGDI